MATLEKSKDGKHWIDPDTKEKVGNDFPAVIEEAKFTLIECEGHRYLYRKVEGGIQITTVDDLRMVDKDHFDAWMDGTAGGL